jgi:hypothetical protein
MFNKNNKQNNSFKTVYDQADTLAAVRCKIIVDKGTITNYLITIEDYVGGITVLLDRMEIYATSKVIIVLSYTTFFKISK